MNGQKRKSAIHIFFKNIYSKKVLILVSPVLNLDGDRMNQSYKLLKFNYGSLK